MIEDDPSNTSTNSPVQASRSRAPQTPAKRTSRTPPLIADDEPVTRTILAAHLLDQLEVVATAEDAKSAKAR